MSLGIGEPTLKYHPGYSGVLTAARHPGPGHCLGEGLSEIEIAVPMQFTRSKTERPREPLLQLDSDTRD